MTTVSWQRTRMQQVGLTLVVVGLLDIASCGVAISRGTGYRSSLSIFALVAGVLVYCGHVGAVRVVVHLFSFMLGGFVLLPLLVLSGEYAMGSAVAPIRPLEWGLAVLSWMAMMALFYWVRQGLAELPIFDRQRPAAVLLRSPHALVGLASGISLMAVAVAMGYSAAHR